MTLPAPTDAALRRLQGTWLLHDLPDAALRALATGAIERALAPGEVLLTEGERGDSLYVVLEGALELTQAGPAGARVLGEVRRGEHLGELALLEDAPRSATATALEPTRLLALSRASFEACLALHPDATTTLGRLRALRRAFDGVRRLRPPPAEIEAQLARLLPSVPHERLAELRGHVEWLALPAGATLFRHGEAGDAVYFVVDGALEVFAERDDGRAIRLGEAGPGEPIGELALLSGEPRSASVRALQDAALLKLDRAGFSALLAAHPEAMAPFARAVATRLARAARGRNAIVQLRSSQVLSPEVCAQAVAITDPVLLNLTITQLYHRLSLDLTLLLGAQDANWFAFGCRASKTAGRAIRGEELPLRALLHGTPLWPLVTRGLARAEALRLHGLVQDLLRTVGERVAAGNRLIFEEIGPINVRFVGAFSQERDFDAARRDAFLAVLDPSPSERGGQQTLRGALHAWYEAAFERSAKRRAELILLGSMKMGLHEQLRVDPILDRALTAPLEVFFDAAAALLPRPLRPAAALARPRLDRALRALLTRRMMRFQLPRGALALGEDVPPWSPTQQWSPMLETLEHPELRALFDRLVGQAPSRARDWSELSERMRYIATLFRTQQKSLQLFEPPYLEAQEAEIRAGRVPTGAL